MSIGTLDTGLLVILLTVLTAADLPHGTKTISFWRGKNNMRLTTHVGHFEGVGLERRAVHGHAHVALVTLVILIPLMVFFCVFQALIIFEDGEAMLIFLVEHDGIVEAQHVTRLIVNDAGADEASVNNQRIGIRITRVTAFAANSLVTDGAVSAAPVLGGLFVDAPHAILGRRIGIVVEKIEDTTFASSTAFIRIVLHEFIEPVGALPHVALLKQNLVRRVDARCDVA